MAKTRSTTKRTSAKAPEETPVVSTAIEQEAAEQLPIEEKPVETTDETAAAQETVVEKPAESEPGKEVPETVTGENPAGAEAEAVGKKEQTQEDAFFASTTPIVKTTAMRLRQYADTMKPGKIQQNGVGMQRELLGILMHAISEAKDFAEFKEVFKVINYFYSEESKGAFASTHVNRFFNLWTYGTRQRLTLSSMNHVFCTLAKTTTRSEAIKKIDIDKAFSGTLVGPDRVAWIKRFYKL